MRTVGSAGDGVPPTFQLINDAAVKEWIARESPMAAGGAAAELGPAKKYLTSWREILVALGMKNNNEDREKARNLNDRYDAIVIPRQAPTQGR